MSTPTVTLRSLKNTDTEIDVSVPGFKEEKAPLGGVSILYEISVLTSLNLFKTSLHSQEDVVHFSIFKAYREVFDLYNKLSKKYPSATLPPLPKANLADELETSEKIEILDSFMKALSRNAEVCSSPPFMQFIGIHSLRDSTKGVVKTVAADSSQSLDEKEIFQKMKNVEKDTSKPFDSSSQSATLGDLFDQIKITEDYEIKSNLNKQSPTNNGFFDEFDDDNLFNSKPHEKKPTQTREINNKAANAKSEVVSNKKTIKDVPKIDDPEIIIKDRKKGDISLFKEQDFGEYINEEEEALFLVTKSNDVKTNSLLKAKNEILSLEEDLVPKENLDELLDLTPLPVEPKQDVVDSSVPVPLPRKKSLKSSDIQKPEVKPRKVFLNKNEDCQKPSVPPKPSSSSAKPKVPPKPKPPPRQTRDSELRNGNLDAENANKPEANDNSTSTVSSFANDLEEFDILKYIEQEEKSLDSNLSLFD